jgi:hypothetical protein
MPSSISTCDLFARIKRDFCEKLHKKLLFIYGFFNFDSSFFNTSRYLMSNYCFFTYLLHNKVDHSLCIDYGMQVYEKQLVL